MAILSRLRRFRNSHICNRLSAAAALAGTGVLPISAFGCNLPVCDVDIQLKQLEEKGQGYRFEFISKLKSQYAKEKSKANLDQLLKFARAALKLVEKLQDEDYVLREASSLKDQTLYLLVQWVWRDCETLSSAYSELRSEGQRYASLGHFLQKSGEFRDQTLIKNLVCFAQSAEKTSRTEGDPEYLARQAQTLASALSKQLLEIFNGWEGSFRVLEIEGPLAEEQENLRLILFSSGGDLGIVAALSHPTLPPMVFQNITFEGEPQTLVSRQSFASQVPSVIELRFDEDFRRAEGWVLDPIHLLKTHFKIERQVSVPSIALRPCSEAQLAAQYKTTLAGHQGIFSLQKIGPAQYAGVFATPSGEFRLPFSFGRYNELTGRTSLINRQANVPLAWRLSAEQTSKQQCHLRGWGLSAHNAQVYPLQLEPMD